MSWGWKIVIVYMSFVIMTLSMVFYFMRHDVELVADDYYKQEIEYQQQIDKISNTISMGAGVKVSIDKQGNQIKMMFPKEQVATGISGEIHLYRPSSARADQKLEIRPKADGEQTIPIGSLAVGLWKIKISWSSGGYDFYDEKTITL